MNRPPEFDLQFTMNVGHPFNGAFTYIPMIKICLDTNAFYNNWMALGEAFTLLAELIAKNACEVFISEVSAQEHVRHYDKAKTQIESQLKADVSKYSKLFIDGGKATVAPRLCDTATFEGRFRARLKELGITRLPIPAVPHGELLARDLAEKKPFSPSGKGYRDALIWLSFLTVIDENTGKAVLVTSNSNDYCLKFENNKASLHPDLVAEVQEKNPNAEALWFASPQKLADGIVKPMLKQVEEDQKKTAKLLKKIQEGSYKPVNLASVVSEGLDNFEGKESEGTFYGGDAPLEEPIYITEVHDPEEIEASELYKLSSGFYVCEGTVDVSATVEGYLDKFEAFNQSESGAVFVSDPHWNETYSEVEVSNVPARVTFSFEFDGKTGEVQRFEVTKVESIH